MKLSVNGSKKHKKIIREATKFFASQLMKPRLVDQLNIRIFLLESLFDGCVGWIEFDDIPRPKDFRIDILNTFSMPVLVKTLAHEMVHVKQYSTGETKEMANGRTKYHGKIYEASLDYWEQPWEIEAMGRERKLLKDFFKSINREDILQQKEKIIDLI